MTASFRLRKLATGRLDVCQKCDKYSSRVVLSAAEVGCTLPAPRSGGSPALVPPISAGSRRGASVARRQGGSASSQTVRDPSLPRPEPAKAGDVRGDRRGRLGEDRDERELAPD